MSTLMWEWVFAFVDPLDRAGIPYAIVGSVASSIYGEPRATNDVDMLVLVGENGAKRLFEAFPESDYYVTPEETIAVELTRRSGAHLNVISQTLMMKADLYPATADHEDWLARRRAVSIGGRTVWLACPESVIVHKLRFHREDGSERHMRDLRRVLAVRGDSLDMAWLEKEIARHGLAQLWKVLKDSMAP
jgi:hypothetical protein